MKKLWLFLLLLFPLWGLPPFISFEERIKECSFIMIGNIKIVWQKRLFEDTYLVSFLVETQEILKNTYQNQNLEIPKNFFLYIYVYPETYENKIKFKPEDGKYILFLNPVVKENQIVNFELYEEEPFALEPWSKEKELEIRAIISQQNSTSEG
ncbi:MAG: hypothetical protein NZ853_02075 [Leptospiraceae bacterium]|nr:hypothetical protein [Leptospiraceae bacterium]MDW7975987.1 hypothetical protein [Leptospiraceae bacterium]